MGSTDTSSYQAWPVDAPQPPKRQLISSFVAVPVRKTVETCVQLRPVLRSRHGGGSDVLHVLNVQQRADRAADVAGLDPPGEPVEGIGLDGHRSRPGGVTALLGTNRQASRSGSPRPRDAPAGVCLAAPGTGGPTGDAAGGLIFKRGIGQEIGSRSGRPRCRRPRQNDRKPEQYHGTECDSQRLVLHL